MGGGNLIAAVVIVAAVPFTPAFANAIQPDSPPERTLDSVREVLKEGRYTEAVASARSLMEKIEAAGGADSIEAAEVMEVLVEALWRSGNGRAPGTLELARRAQSIKEKAFGPDDIRVATSLHALGNLLLAIGEAGDSRPVYERALAIRQTVLGPDHIDVGKTLLNLGRARSASAEMERARPLLERALAIFERTYGPDHPDVGRCLSALAWNEHVAGLSGAARPLYLRALAIAERNLGQEHPSLIPLLINLGILDSAKGESAGARAYVHRALSIREKALREPNDRVEQARIISTLAFLDWGAGDHDSARALFEESIGIQEEALGPDDVRLSRDLENLANLLIAASDYAGAGSRFERALGILEKTHGSESSELAGALIGLAKLRLMAGDADGARPFHQRALAVWEKSARGDPIDTASKLTRLANILYMTGDTAGAKPLYERACSLFEVYQGPDHPDFALSLNNLAALLLETGELPRAKALFERALAIREKVKGPDHADTAESLNDLGTLLRVMGKPEAARPLLERALAVRATVFGEDDPRVAESRLQLAKVHSDTGQVREAIDFALKAEEAARGHLGLNLGALPERQALRYALSRVSGLDLALSLVAGKADGPSRRKVWDSLIRSRAFVLDEMAARRRAITESRDPVTARLAAELEAARRRLANILAQGAFGGEIESLARRAEQAREEQERAERALAEKSLEYRQGVRESSAGFHEVSAALPPRSALVGFATYRHHDSPASPGGTAGGRDRPTLRFPRPGADSTSGERYLAFLLRSGWQDPEVIPLGSRQEIDALVRRWTEETVLPALLAGDGGASEQSYRAAGEALRRRIWDPIVSRLAGARVAFLVLEGSLQLVNVAALPTGGATYLIETGPLIHHLSAERDLPKASARVRGGSGLLAVGGPSFDGPLHPTPPRAASRPNTADVTAGEGRERPVAGASSSCRTFQETRFEPLPESVREAEEVARLWRRATARRDPGEGPREILLTGEAATEAGFKKSAPGRSVLHLATHGFVLGERCPSIVVSLRGVGTLVLPRVDDLPAPVPGENPLLLSGLALAGANRRTEAGAQEEDGILTAAEVASMDLSTVSWAVLSACSTGAGEVQIGEGVLGLRRAFQVAGAGTLIMSLWPVGDEPTREWMRALYRARFEKGLRTPEAVRDAGLHVLRVRRDRGLSTHPFFWGGFVASGDWR